MKLEDCINTYGAANLTETSAFVYGTCLQAAEGCNETQNLTRTQVLEELTEEFGTNFQDISTFNPITPEFTSCDVFNCSSAGNSFDDLFQGIEQVVSCLNQISDSCPLHTLYFRQRLYDVALEEVKMECALCPLPSVKTTPTDVQGVLASDITCGTANRICGAEVNVLFQPAFRFYLEHVNCQLSFARNCLFSPRYQEWKGLIEASVHFGLLFYPDMTFPEFDLQKVPKTCYEALLLCSAIAHEHRYRDSVVYNTSLNDAYDCTVDVSLCASNSDDQMYHQYLLQEILIELANESLARQDNGTSTFISEDCRENVEICQTIFNIRPSGQRREDELLTCLNRITDCTPAEIAYREAVRGDLMNNYIVPDQKMRAEQAQTEDDSRSISL